MSDLRSGFLYEEDVQALRARICDLALGKHTLYDNATFEPPFRLNHPLQNFRGTIGAFSYCQSRLGGAQNIGRYCSIASDVHFGGAEHPMPWISMSPFSYDADYIFGRWLEFTGKTYEQHAQLPESHRRFVPIEIGNDVWIGRGGFVRAGVRVGDGAVIGAHAVVTKDVEPFAVVAGNPARVIRRRFSDRLVERIQARRWWDYKFSDFNGLTVEDPERFLDQLDERIANNAIRPYIPISLRGSNVAALLRAVPEQLNKND
jgi:acetyltransferase-like isoleucine patch superfamily enzyme